MKIRQAATVPPRCMEGSGTLAEVRIISLSAKRDHKLTPPGLLSAHMKNSHEPRGTRLLFLFPLPFIIPGYFVLPRSGCCNNCSQPRTRGRAKRAPCTDGLATEGPNKGLD